MDIIPQNEIFLRLLVTLVVAFLLGLEREYRNQPAGLRTHILIGVGSCLLMILSILVPEIYNSNINDPGRIAAQVVSGIGFLGAGAIIKMGIDTRGLTTAANIWVTAALGMTFGAGLYTAGFAATVIILIDLIIITEFKRYFIVPSRFCTIDVHFLKKKGKTHEIYSEIKKLPLTIISKTIKEDGKFGQLKIISKIRKDEDIFAIKDDIKKIADIEKISVAESVKA